MTVAPGGGGDGDGWLAGDAYEEYMGRWSRPLALQFVEWLRPEPFGHWLEVGCGTGALTAAIGALGRPASIVACDPAEPFLEHARRSLRDERVSFVVAGADSLPRRADGFEAIVSGLALNFFPDPAEAVAQMGARLRRGGTLAACVWDYAEGMQFLRHFWDEAAVLDPEAAALDEGRRFPLCREGELAALFRAAGFEHVETTSLEVPTDFATFDDYWTPFLRGTGPAPGYVASLEPASREALEDRLRRSLTAGPDGRIRLRARAWAVRGAAP